MWSSSASTSGASARQTHRPTPSSIDKHFRPASRSEQLHQWSIYRQQLNATLSQSALSGLRRTGPTIPSHCSTGSSILSLRSGCTSSSTKGSGLQPLNSLDTDTLDYLHFGLPRVQTPSIDQLKRDRFDIGIKSKPLHLFNDNLVHHQDYHHLSNQKHAISSSSSSSKHNRNQNDLQSYLIMPHCQRQHKDQSVHQYLSMQSLPHLPTEDKSTQSSQLIAGKNHFTASNQHTQFDFEEQNLAIQDNKQKSMAGAEHGNGFEKTGISVDQPSKQSLQSKCNKSIDHSMIGRNRMPHGGQSMLELTRADERQNKPHRAASVGELRPQLINRNRLQSVGQLSCTAASFLVDNTKLATKKKLESEVDSFAHVKQSKTSDTSSKDSAVSMPSDPDSSGGLLLGSSCDETTSERRSQLDSNGSVTAAIRSTKKNRVFDGQLLVRSLYYEYDCTSNSGLLCGGVRQKVRVLDNISFQVLSGQMLLLLATNEMESSSILNLLSGQQSRNRTRSRTQLMLNGHPVTPKQLSRVVSHVDQSNNLCPEMSVRQTLLFHSLIETPARPARPSTKHRIDQLLLDFGLQEVRHTSVGQLSGPEIRRLRLATALLQDTQLLLLDQPAKEMDLFDMFFMFQYIRQWTHANNRMTIVAMQPPTHEIFTLFDQVALISTGRIVYSGPTNQMASYFAQADYPCPEYKSQADYLLDLVTVDQLSQEAMVESSARIEQFVQLHVKRSSPLRCMEPGSMPPQLIRSHFILCFLSLWIRALIFTFPYNMLRLFQRLLLALCLSLACGGVYWQVRSSREQENVWDQYSMYHVLLFLFPLPLFLLEIHHVFKQKPFVLSELKSGVYSRTAFFASSFIYSLPAATLTFLAFAYPACSLAGPKSHTPIFLILLIGYLHTMRLFVIALSWCFRSKAKCTAVFLIVYLLLLTTAGGSFHATSINAVSRLLYVVSPASWTLQSLLHWEFTYLGPGSTAYLQHQQPRFVCSHNPLVQHANAIVSRADCGVQQSDHLFSFLGFRPSRNVHWTQATHVQLIYSFLMIVAWYIRLQTLDTNVTKFARRSKVPLLQRRRKITKEVI